MGQLIKNLDFTNIDSKTWNLTYLTKTLVSRYSGKNLAKYVDLKNFVFDNNNSKDFVEILSWNSLTQAKCMHVLTMICKDGFECRDFIIIIKAIDRLLQRN